MSVLCLHVPEQWDLSRSDLAWHWSDDAGGSGVLGAGAAPPPTREIRLLVPASRTLHAVLTVTRRGRWQDTLAYALEDRLLDDPDSLHVAAGPARADGRTPVVAIDRNWLTAALDRARALGVAPQSAYSAADVETGSDGEWLVLADTEGSVLIDEQGLPVALDLPPEGEAPRLLTAQLLACEASRRPQRIRLRVRPGVDGAALAAAWSACLPVAVATGSLWTGQPGPLRGDCVNLLQGGMASRRGARLSSNLGAWRPAAILLLVSALVWMIALLVQTWQWQLEVRQLSARSEAALRRAFPETRTILDPALQMQRGLKDLRARAGVGPAAGPALLMTRVGGVGDGLPARLRQLTWRDGALDLDWECGDASCLQALQQRLLEPARGLAATALRVEGQHVHVHLTEATR